MAERRCSCLSERLRHGSGDRAVPLFPCARHAHPRSNPSPPISSPSPHYLALPWQGLDWASPANRCHPLHVSNPVSLFLSLITHPRSVNQTHHPHQRRPHVLSLLSNSVFPSRHHSRSAIHACGAGSFSPSFCEQPRIGCRQTSLASFSPATTLEPPSNKSTASPPPDLIPFWLPIRFDNSASFCC